MSYTVLVKSFAHLNGNFFLASLEEIGKLPNKKRQFKNRFFHTPPCSELVPLSQGGSQKIHSIKCAKCLTSTVKEDMCNSDRFDLIL